MSEFPIFVVGVVIFAITVYGVVVTGGLLMTRQEIAENERIHGDATDPAPPSDPTSG